MRISDWSSDVCSSDLYEREDASQLDQRYEGKYARADVTMPIGPTVALLGGVGYEDIEIGQRDPLLDADGVPVRDANGRFVTDTSSPRRLSFDTDEIGRASSRVSEGPTR